jgi:hypothetical protein
MTIRRVLALLLLASGCATTGGDRASDLTIDEPGVKGQIGWFRRSDDYLMWESAWTETRVAAGPRGGPANARFDLQPDGTWRSGGVAVLTVQDSRITGPAVNVTYTRIEGGFRLTGLWFKRNVDLTVDGTGARAQAYRYTRNPAGAYVSSETPNNYVLLQGEAGWLDDPPWPHLALAFLCFGWGVEK